MFNNTYGHSAGVKASVQAIEVGELATAFRNHTWHVSTRPIAWNADINWAVRRIHGLGIGAIAAVGLTDSILTGVVTMRVVQVGIHFRI